MTRQLFLITLVLTGFLKARSQSYDTAQFRLDKEQIQRDAVAAKKGDLKRRELNLNEWTIENEKTIKFKKNKINKPCSYKYKDFKFVFEYQQFLNALKSSYGNYVIMESFRMKDFNSDTINVNTYVLKPQDETFMVDYLIKLAVEKTLSVFDIKEKIIIEKVTLKKAFWETKTNKGEATLFYFNNSYTFYRNDRICTSKRFND